LVGVGVLGPFGEAGAVDYVFDCWLHAPVYDVINLNTVRRFFLFDSRGWLPVWNLRWVIVYYGGSVDRYMISFRQFSVFQHFGILPLPVRKSHF
jgi:hypothetical protein